MCMTFSCNPEIIFYHFVSILNLVLAHLVPKHISTGYLGNATPPTILPISFLNLAAVLCASDFDVT